MNPSYALLARAMFQTLERLAATDTKHGDRLRLESYAYFVTAISEAGQAVPVLQWHVHQAASAKQRAMQAYVQQQLEHGKFWKLMEFSMVCVCVCTFAPADLVCELEQCYDKRQMCSSCQACNNQSSGLACSCMLTPRAFSQSIGVMHVIPLVA